MSTSVRPAGVEDGQYLAQLRAQWRGTEATPEFVAAFERWYVTEQASRRWWLAFADGGAIGMVNLKIFERMPEPDGHARRWGYLANLYVAPERRGLGAGRALTDAVLSYARAENFVRVLLSPSEASRPLYLRAGFRVADELLLHTLND